MHFRFTACEIRNVSRTSLRARCSGEMPSSYIVHVLEQETDWGPLQRLASTPCTCSGPRVWWAAVSDFFQRNRATPHCHAMIHQCRQKLGAGPLSERLRPKSCRLLSCARGQHGTQFFGDYKAHAVHLLG